MKNSNELFLPLCSPFACYDIDSDRTNLGNKVHFHYFAELLLLREGSLRVFVGEEEYILSPGEALIICPGVRHLAVPEGGKPVRMDVIRMDPDRMPELPEYVPDLKIVLAEALRERLPMHFQASETERLLLPQLSADCIRESRSRRYGYDLAVPALMSLINVVLLRYWISQGLTLTGERLAQVDPIYSLSGYIQEHLCESLRVESLAARCGLSYPWFARKFRETYGISCKEYIEQVRTATVEKYLLFTDLDLAAISEKTGYSDCSHMIKNFKRVMNITPGQFRLRERDLRWTEAGKSIPAENI